VPISVVFARARDGRLVSMPADEIPERKRPVVSVRDAFDDPLWRKAARQTLAQEPAGGPRIAIPLLGSCGLLYIGMIWILTGGEDGQLVLRILGLPMIALGGAALRFWWCSFARKVETRLPRHP
jgi:hypothetical protein